MEYYLGIDIGTGSCKSSIITDQGVLLAIGSSSYSNQTEPTQWKAQNPEVILEGMIRAVQDVISKFDHPAENIKAVSIGCALHGMLAIDKHGTPLTDVYTWADDRANLQAKKIKETPAFKKLYQQTGCPSHGMYPLYKIIWLRENEPEIFENAAKFISVKEYILAKLCEEYVIDYSIASGTGLLNILTHQWNPLSLELAEITHEQLSSLGDPRKILQIKNQKLADQLGIPMDIPLILGSSDAANSNLGAGSVSPTQATCMIGTSGAYRIISPKPILSPDASSWCYCLDTDSWLVGGAINNGGLALSWLKDAFQSISQEELSFEQLLAFAEKSEIGGEGLMCLPLFAGERSPNWNLESRAVFFGLSLEHDVRHISRAILEGIAFRIRNLDEILFDMAVDIQEIRASGGFTRSTFWIQLMTNVLGRPISVPAEGETSCFGAALWCYLALNPSAQLSDLQEFVTISKTFYPEPEQKRMYDSLYSFYKKLYKSVSPLFGQLANIQSAKRQRVPPALGDKQGLTLHSPGDCDLT